jgi:hypothetical protein
MEIRAAELTADHLGRRIRVDRTDDDQTFVIAYLSGSGTNGSGNPPTGRPQTRLDLRCSAVSASLCGSTVWVWLSFSETNPRNRATIPRGSAPAVSVGTKRCGGVTYWEVSPWQ